MIQTVSDWITAIRKYPELLKEYRKLFEDYSDQELTVINLRRNISICEEYTNSLKVQLEEKYNQIKKEEKLEQYWNNKREKVFRTWRARGGVTMDVRSFFQVDGTLPTFKGTNDQKAKNALNFVIDKIQYVGEKGEFWQYAYETMLRGAGDCDDGGILIANMMLMSGVPYWRIRLNMGWVKKNNRKVYHLWCTYLREKDDKWVVLDWCYWPNESKYLGNLWSNAEKYFKIDCSWNTKYAYGIQTELDRK